MQFAVKKKLGLSLAFVAALLPGLASAAGLSDLTSSIDFAEVGTAVLAIAGSLAAVYLLWKGASLILRAVRGL
jgi:hypothetical protein